MPYAAAFVDPITSISSQKFSRYSGYLNSWGQQERVLTSGRCFRCNSSSFYSCADAADLIGCMRTLLACWTPRTVAKAGMMSLPLTAWQHIPSPWVAACPTRPSPIFTHSTISYVTLCTQGQCPHMSTGLTAYPTMTELLSGCVSE